MNIPTTSSFFARNGMYVTKETIRQDKQTLAQNPPIPTNPDTSINYPSLDRKFTYALNEFSYRWNGDPLRSMWSQHGPDSDTSDEEFSDLEDGVETIKPLP
jgi:hypothetical protein